MPPGAGGGRCRKEGVDRKKKKKKKKKGKVHVKQKLGLGGLRGAGR